MSFHSSFFRRIGTGSLVAIVTVLLVAAGILVLPLRGQSDQSASQQQPAEPPDEAGGPQNDVGPMAIPKKKEEPPPEEKPKPPKKPAGMPEYSLHVDATLVSVPVLVTTKEGRFIPGLKEGNFRVLEDGVPQQISSFNQTQNAPITAVLLTEFASTNYFFIIDALNGAYSFANSLKPDDWIAVMYYDMKPHILVDFTQDKREVFGALRQLRQPMWSETNLFDALYEAVDRLDRLDGRKYIILISSGRDTFSKLNYDNVLKQLKETRNVTVFAVSTGQFARLLSPGDCPRTSIDVINRCSDIRMDYLQADNQMTTIAHMTGGQVYFPRFQAAFPEVFADIAHTIRNQYILAYHPTNAKQDGRYRKIKVELTDGDGHPLKVHDQKGKDVKYQIVARDGYKAKQVVE
ncbi:MAG: VWA domain-containing protein [Terriglobales bacterium]